MQEQDEATSHGAKKFILYGVLGFFGLLILGLVGSYFLMRPFLADLPNQLKASLEKEGISLEFKLGSPPKGRLGFEMTEVHLSGNPLPVNLKAENLSLSVQLVPKPRPLHMTLNLSRALIEKNSQHTPKDSTSKSKPFGGFSAKAAGLAVKLIETHLTVEDLSAPEFGFNHLHYNLILNRLGFTSAGPQVMATHKLKVEEVLIQPHLNNLELKGKVEFTPPTIHLNDQTLSASFFSIIFKSAYNLDTNKWTLDSKIPKVELAARPIIINSAIKEYLNVKEGNLTLTASLQGEGPDTKKIQGEGSLEIDKFKSQVKHPSLEGTIDTSIKASFKKHETLEIETDADVNLDDLMIRHENLFYKEQGVPLKLELHVKGNEKNFQIKPSKFTFHSLNSTFAGDVAVNPTEHTNIQFKIEPTDLVRWERFFPKSTTVRTAGSFSADGSFSGTIEKWQTGKLTLNLLAQDVQFPFLPEWNTNKNASIIGTVHLNSKTQIELDGGTIKTLGTDSQINLANTEVNYGSFFKKPTGTPLGADIVITSTSSKANIKKGSFELGQMKFKAAGTINDFKNPVASLTINSSPIHLNQILDLSPSIKPQNVSKMAGIVSLATKVSGALLSPKGPNVNGTLDIKNLSLGYELDSKKKIQLLNLAGPIAFTNNSLNAQRIAFAFPNTQGHARVSIADFKAPSVKFDLNAPRFSMNDFYDMPKGSKVPPGAMPVPHSNKKDSKEDFRSNPFLRALTVNGTAKIQKADLGYTTAENVSAKIDFRKMRLRIDPFKMNVFGGTVISDTDWNGEPTVPVTKQTLKVENVNANQFLSSYSEKAKDLVEGRFYAQMGILFSGLDPEEIKKSLEGTGNFSLKEGRIKTVRLTKGPLESLKKVPQLGASISKTDWDEKLNDATGQFSIKNGQLALSNLVLHSPYFDATASSATVDMEQKIQAKVVWTPKNNILSGDAYEMLKDEQGKTSLPLTVSGSVFSPSIGLDSGLLEERAKNYLSRRLASEKERAIQEAKRRAEEEGKKKLQNAVKDKLPKGIGNLFQ